VVMKVMKPDKEYMNKLESTEKQTLLHIQSRLSDSDKDYIAKAQDLLEYQEKNRENVGVLPSLKVSDIAQFESIANTNTKCTMKSRTTEV